MGRAVARPWDRSGVHSDAIVGEAQEVGHGRPFEASTGGDAVNPHLGVSPNKFAVFVIDLPVKIGFFVLDLFGDREGPGRCWVLVNAGGHGGPADLLVAAEKNRLLGVYVDLDAGDVFIASIPLVEPGGRWRLDRLRRRLFFRDWRFRLRFGRIEVRAGRQQGSDRDCDYEGERARPRSGQVGSGFHWC